MTKYSDNIQEICEILTMTAPAHVPNGISRAMCGKHITEDPDTGDAVMDREGVANLPWGPEPSWVSHLVQETI